MKTVTIDPVCGMEVDETTRFEAERSGMVYLFCSERCLQRFLSSPDDFSETEEAEEEKEEQAQTFESRQREEGWGSSWQDYIPLMVIVGLSILAAGALQFSGAAEFSGVHWMHSFMGFFLVVFSMFKFFDLEGFADGFQMYDLLAKKIRAYAYVYPFIELGLGLGYLARWEPAFIYGATVVVMVFGSLGVLRALQKGLDVECACMGTVLSVPLSTVALVENVSMAAMAGVMLARLAA